MHLQFQARDPKVQNESIFRAGMVALLATCKLDSKNLEGKSSWDQHFYCYPYFKFWTSLVQMTALS